MENVDQTTGIIFKNLGEHQYRLDNHRDCINNLADVCSKAIVNFDWRIKLLGIGSLLSLWLMCRYDKQNKQELANHETVIRQMNRDIIELKCQVEELKQVEGE